MEHPRSTDRKKRGREGDVFHATASKLSHRLQVRTERIDIDSVGVDGILKIEVPTRHPDRIGTLRTSSADLAAGYLSPARAR